MPSPFPGMDPYLEGELWQEFHETLAGEIRAQLLKVLPPKYVALLAKRYVIERPSVSLMALSSEQHVIYPDVHVAELPRVAERQSAYAASGMTAPSVRSIGLTNVGTPVLTVEIRDVAQRRLVTVIEILSPANKQGYGAVEYDVRRRLLFGTHTHLLEIDLLRCGLRLTFEDAPPPADYYIYLSRFTDRPYTDIWPIGLRDRLPTVPAPLLPPDEDAPLELQRAVDACFQLVGYERLLDYSAAPPPPPLSEADAAWLAERLAAR